MLLVAAARASLCEERRHCAPYTVGGLAPLRVFKNIAFVSLVGRFSWNIFIFIFSTIVYVI